MSGNMYTTYPRVMTDIAVENGHAIYGKILTISMAIFNSKLLVSTRGYTSWTFPHHGPGFSPGNSWG